MYFTKERFLDSYFNVVYSKYIEAKKIKWWGVNKSMYFLLVIRMNRKRKLTMHNKHGHI